MNILYWFILFVVVFVIYVWHKRRQHYNSLPLNERLWEDWLRTKGKEPEVSIAEKKLSDYICGAMEVAESSSALSSIHKDLANYYRNRPFAINGRYGIFSTTETKACFAKMEAEFARKRNEANRLLEEAEAEKETKRFKAAQDATKWEEANAVLVGNHFETPSRVLALQKMDRFSLNEVLAAKTLSELKTASERARPESLARKFVPFMHEFISRREVESAGIAEEIIAAAERAPKEVLQKAFIKLHGILLNG